jgi:hypothetical protein
MSTHITVMSFYASARHATVSITAPVHTAPRCSCFATPALASALELAALDADVLVDDGLLVVLEWNGLTSVAVTLSMPVNEYRGAGAVTGAVRVVSALQRYASVRMESAWGFGWKLTNGHRRTVRARPGMRRGEEGAW